MLHDWMDWVRDAQLMIEELQPMLDIEYGTRLRQSFGLPRVAGTTKLPKVLHAHSMSSRDNRQER
jgi:hypothetical protein